MDKIDVLHIRSSGGVFGAEGVILNLAKELNRQNFINIVICINNFKNPHLELIDECKKMGIEAEAVFCQGRVDVKVIRNIRKLLRKYNINILHCHDYKANFFGFFASRGLNIKIIATNHLWTKATRSLRIYERIDGFILRFFDQVIAVSDSIKKDILKSGVPEQKVITIYNGIDLGKFDLNCSSEYLRQEFNIPSDIQIVGTAGRLTVEKSQSYLLDAAVEVLKILPKTIFLIVGDGPLKMELVQKTKSLGIEKNVIFTGLRKDMVNIYNLFDIFVSSSFREGIPLVILEALAMKKPVIATDVGGVAKLVIDNQTGILLQPGDLKSLASAIVTLLKDRDKAKSMGEKGRRLVESNFSAKVMANNYLKVYEGILKERKV